MGGLDICCKELNKCVGTRIITLMNGQLQLQLLLRLIYILAENWKAPVRFIWKIFNKNFSVIAENNGFSWTIFVSIFSLPVHLSLVPRRRERSELLDT